MHEGASTFQDLLVMTVDTLFEFVESTLPSAENLKLEEQGFFWSPSFIYCLDKLDHQDKGSGVARNSSTNKLLSEHLENQ